MLQRKGNKHHKDIRLQEDNNNEVVLNLAAQKTKNIYKESCPKLLNVLEIIFGHWSENLCVVHSNPLPVNICNSHMAMGWRQGLPLSVVQLKGKHY